MLNESKEFLVDLISEIIDLKLIYIYAKIKLRKYMDKYELIEEIKKAPIRYAYTEMFLLKKSFFFHEETFFVSDYGKFVGTMLEFLLEKSLETEIQEQPTRFYNTTPNREKVFKSINVEIYYNENLNESKDLKVDRFKLVDTSIFFEKINRIYIAKVKKKLSNIKDKRKNIVVLLRFDTKEKPFGLVNQEEKTYWNKFIARNDYKFFYSFIRNRKIDVIKKYSEMELNKNIRLKAMAHNGEILFFKKLIEKELLIDCAKYINENYIRKGFDIWGKDRKNISILNMLKILDIKTLNIMEEDCLVYSLLNQRELVEFYITKGDIDWRYKYKEAREHGFQHRLFYKGALEVSRSRENYLKLISLIFNKNMIEMVDYLITNEMDTKIDQYLKALFYYEVEKEVKYEKKERFIILTEQINKLVSYRHKSNQNNIDYEYNIELYLMTNIHLSEYIMGKKISKSFENIRNTLQECLLTQKEEAILFFNIDKSPFSCVGYGMFGNFYLNYGCWVLDNILKIKDNKEINLDIKQHAILLAEENPQIDVTIVVTDIQLAIKNLDIAYNISMQMMKNFLRLRYEKYIVDIETNLSFVGYSDFVNNTNILSIFKDGKVEQIKDFYLYIDEKMNPIVHDVILRNKLADKNNVSENKLRKKI